MQFPTTLNITFISICDNKEYGSYIRFLPKIVDLGQQTK